MRSAFKYIPRLWPAVLLGLGYFVARNLNTLHSDPTVDFPLAFGFSAGFPTGGENLCLDKPFCVQAYVFDPLTSKTLLQIERSPEVEGVEEQARLAAEAVVEQATAGAMMIEVYTRSREYIYRQMSFRRDESMMDLLIALRQETLFTPEYFMGVLLKEKFNTQYLAGEFKEELDSIQSKEYHYFHQRCKNTFFKPEYQKALTRLINPGESPGNAAEHFNLDLLKNLILRLNVDYNSTQDEYNEDHHAVSHIRNGRFFSGRVKMKGRIPVGHHETFQDAFSSVAEMAEADAKTRWRNVILAFSMCLIAIPAILSESNKAQAGKDHNKQLTNGEQPTNGKHQAAGRPRIRK